MIWRLEATAAPQFGDCPRYSDTPARCSPWQKVAFQTVEVGETDQILTVAVECTPMYDANNGILTAVAKCGVDGIGQ
jgi:hypothetical protein